MAWRRTGDKPLSEPMMVSLPTHICATRPQWVNTLATESENSQHYLISSCKHFHKCDNVRQIRHILFTFLNIWKTQPNSSRLCLPLYIRFSFHSATSCWKVRTRQTWLINYIIFYLIRKIPYLAIPTSARNSSKSRLPYAFINVLLRFSADPNYGGFFLLFELYSLIIRLAKN